MNLQNIPRLIVDQFGITYSKELFALGFQCGQNQAGFCLTPAGAKNLSNTLARLVAEHEQKFGEIDMTGVDSGIQSPIDQM